MRKAASVAKPTCEITQNGDEFHVKLVAMKTIEEKFTVGTNFEQTHIHGAEYVVKFSLSFFFWWFFSLDKKHRERANNRTRAMGSQGGVSGWGSNQFRERITETCASGGPRPPYIYSVLCTER